jgi:hypothetical protein
MKLGAACAIAAFALVGAGCGSSDTSGSSNSSDKVFVMLAEQNGSGESGTATLTPLGDRTKVELELQNAAGRQPAHIHRGSCAELDSNPVYALTDVTAGTSTSTINVRLADLRAGSFAINVHESADEIESYVACGEIDTGRTMDYDPLGRDKESDY